jgi:hypothetical protein
MNGLETRLQAAHEARDHTALIGLYTQAADGAPDDDTACFFLTHAYVFALEQGSDAAAALRARLVAQGRETADA